MTPKKIIPDSIDDIVTPKEAEQLVRQGDGEFPNNEPTYFELKKRANIVTYAYRKIDNNFHEVYSRKYNPKS